MQRRNSRGPSSIATATLFVGAVLLCNCALDETSSDGVQLDETSAAAQRRSKCRGWSWRIRNASVPDANAWALRGLRFCTDAGCSAYATGSVFDDGSAPTWGAPESLFDDDYGNFWKSFAGSRVGEGYVGLDLDRPTTVQAIALRPDNVVYGVSDIFVEYFDDHVGAWVTHTTLHDVPLHYGDINSGGPTYPNDVWYVAPLDVCGSGS